MKRLLPALFVLLLSPWPAVAAEDGIVVRRAVLHAMANQDSKRIGLVSAGTAVSVEARSGGWKRIVSRTQSIDGWIRGYQVRDAASTPTVKVDSGSDSRGFLSGLASFSRRASSFFRSDSGSTSSGTATIGVRGLSEDQIRSAEADFGELQKLQLFASSRKRVGNFARQGGLKAIDVPYIPGKN